MDVMQQFAELTAETAPNLRPVLQDHRDFYEETIAHVYFGELSEWFTNTLATSGSTSELTRLLDLFETSYPTADPDVQNLIDVSFVENVQDDPAVVRLFGPILRSRVDPPYQL